jgi:hypothetical protein
MIKEVKLDEREVHLIGTAEGLYLWK